MDQIEFLELHATYVAAMRAYFVEVAKTAAMLAECTPGPLSFRRRYRLMSQGILESDCHLTYLGARNVLLGAARSGYGSSDLKLHT